MDSLLLKKIKLVSWLKSTKYQYLSCQEAQLMFVLEKYNQNKTLDFPGGPVVRNLPANAGNRGSIPGLGRFHMLQGNKAHLLQLLSLSALKLMSHNYWSPENTLHKSRKKMKSFTLHKIKPERDMSHTSSVRGITKTEGNQSPFIQLSGQTIQYLGRFYNLQSGDKLDPSLPRKLGDWNYFPWWLYFKEMAPKSLRKHS